MIWDADPEIFRVGFFAVRWYSLGFIIGFLIGYRYVAGLLTQDGITNVAEKASSIFSHIFLGTLIGARLGHCLFYEPVEYLTAPWRIFMVWEGGLASHGGFIGVSIGIVMFVMKNKPEFSLFWLLDRIATPALFTGAFIRIGNFMNSEIIGKTTDASYGIIFKRVDDFARHPSMLYESALYFLICIFGFYFSEKKRNTWVPGRILGYILAAGMTARFLVEFTKENQVAFESSLPLNMGQLLSIPFILLGVYLFTGRHVNNTMFDAAMPKVKKIKK